MSVDCPSCKQRIVIKAPKPGRFKIKCAKCNHAFVLTVADDLTMKAATADEPPDDAAEPDDPDVTFAHDAADDARRARPCRAALDDTAAVDAEDVATARAGVRDKDGPEEENDAAMPEVLGNYDIVKRLGKGGMGAVYLARQ